MTSMTNVTFDEIEVGATATLIRTLHMGDIQLFAVMSGDINPAHVDAAYAAGDRFHQIVAHGMTSPLREMTAASRAMANGDYTHRVRATSRMSGPICEAPTEGSPIFTPLAISATRAT